MTPVYMSALIFLLQLHSTRQRGLMYECFVCVCVLQWGTVSYISIWADSPGFAIDRLDLSRSLPSWCRGLTLQPLRHNLTYNITISDFIVHLILSRIHWGVLMMRINIKIYFKEASIPLNCEPTATLP